MSEQDSPLAKRARELGIDPEDRKYHDPHPDESWRPDDRICPWCTRHKERNPRLACDVAMAEAPEGAKACRWCLEPTTNEAPRWCDTCAARIERENEQVKQRYRRSSRAVYRDDGCGCVERVHPTELAIERREGSEENGWL